MVTVVGRGTEVPAGLGFAYDGGHGMLFRDTDGRLYVSFHSPNSTSAGRAETPVFIPVAEQYSKLVPDFWKNLTKNSSMI